MSHIFFWTQGARGKRAYQKFVKMMDILAYQSLWMEGKRIDTIKLKNGLVLELLDHSRRIAGDRWLIYFEALIEVEVKPEYFQGQNALSIPFEEIRTAVGEKVIFRHEKIRNFVPETEKDDVFKELKERFLSTSLGYLSSPMFPSRLILRKYQNARQQGLVVKGH
jgi:hypothetical protein